MEFYKRVALVGEHIPHGKVATYGQIALLCGRPNHARQVGYALNKGRAGEAMPAYRVVNGKGFLSGAAAFAAPDLQRELLQKEGVEVSVDNRVDLKVYGWHHTMEDALLLRTMFEQQGI